MKGSPNKNSIRKAPQSTALRNSHAREAWLIIIAVATTGIAGPGGGTEDKPVGTVALALAQRTEHGFETRSGLYRLWGTREWVKVLTSQLALDWVRCRLLGQEPLDSGFGSIRRKGAAKGAA